jgi:hypothetical protein
MSNAADSSSFTCACKEWMRSACEREPFFKEHEGKMYCVLHFPGEKNFARFTEVLEKKLEIKDFNFSGVWFPGRFSFRHFHFSEKAMFSAAVFVGEADFVETVFGEGASFLSAVFYSKANFAAARFNQWADFRYTGFGGRADFLHAIFSAKANFNSAFFRGQGDFASAWFGEEVNFSGATFCAQTFFSNATFDDYVRFSSEDDLGLHGSENRQPFIDTSSVDFQYIRTEKPDRISFHTLTLHPHWFVNADTRKFDFTNVEWRGSLNQEIKYLKFREVSPPHRLLAIACRQIAVNAEENHRYEEASRFRYMAMDARRLQWLEKLRDISFIKIHWRTLKKTLVRLNRSLRRDWGVQGRTLTRSKRFLVVYWKSFDLLHWLYWAASGYGERIARAFMVLIGIWLIFACLYTQVGFARPEQKAWSESDVAAAKHNEVDAPLRPLSRALTYSAKVMILQRPEPRPITTTAESIVILETILGPLQGALLALAIRRKFMR